MTTVPAAEAVADDVGVVVAPVGAVAAATGGPMVSPDAGRDGVVAVAAPAAAMSDWPYSPCSPRNRATVTR